VSPESVLISVVATGMMGSMLSVDGVLVWICVVLEMSVPPVEG